MQPPAERDAPASTAASDAGQASSPSCITGVHDGTGSATAGLAYAASSLLYLA